MSEVSKFSETADRFKRLRARRVERLDALNTRLDAHESNEDQVFRMYEGAVEGMEAEAKQFEAEAKEMRNAIDHMKDEVEGGQTDSTVAKFPSPDEQAKAS